MRSALRTLFVNASPKAEIETMTYMVSWAPESTAQPLTRLREVEFDWEIQPTEIEPEARSVVTLMAGTVICFWPAVCSPSFEVVVAPSGTSVSSLEVVLPSVAALDFDEFLEYTPGLPSMGQTAFTLREGTLPDVQWDFD